MAEHALYPGYVKLDYHSAWGKHVAIFPTRAWNAAPITGTMGSWENWAGSPIDGEAMVDGLVNHLVPFYLASVAIDIATIYTVAAPGASAIAVKAKSYGLPGTSTSSEHAKATQITWTLRDTAFNLARIVMLDAPSGAGWEPVTGLPGSGPVHDLFAEISTVDNAWSSRAGLRDATFSRITYDLSDKLRREYGMA